MRSWGVGGRGTGKEGAAKNWAIIPTKGDQINIYYIMYIHTGNKQ